MATNLNDFQGANGEGALHHGKKMIEEAKAFREAVNQQASSLTSSIDLRGRVQQNPLLMVAAAAGLGYVLGGGLFSPFTARVMKVGVRLAFLPFLKSQLANIAGGQASEPPRGSAL